jgi:cytochrome c biogenesis protein CcdA/thiol-disulfide isomerase/thioredoxin
MLSLVFVLFIAGLLTILLPCILPLIPIVLGVSIAGRNKWRPLVTVIGMLLSFVGSTLILNVLLSQFVELADYIRIGTYDALLLFGLGFTFHKKIPQLIGAVLGGFFFIDKGWIAVVVAMIVGVIAMEVGGRVATYIQQLGSDMQMKTRQGLGDQSLLGAFLIGLTMGLVWVPCAGPALGFALAVVRNQPGLIAALYLTAYAVGAGIPLLAIGYGGQAAVKSVRTFSKYSGRIKEISGVLLILSALGLQFNLFQNLQTYLADKTGFGNVGNDIEVKLFGNDVGQTSSMPSTLSSSSTTSTSSTASVPSVTSATSHTSTSIPAKTTTSTATKAGTPIPSGLPILGKEPAAFVGLGPWHNSAPLTLADLIGKVVLIDFWTYSCINCIRTLPYIEAYAQKYKDQPFVLIGIHTPEFTFEKSESNVSMAIKEHGLTYPIAQDNNYGTWNAFQNQYWPAKYLIDAQGNIRYTHFGEGNYDETDKAIAGLLGEIGASADTGMAIPANPTDTNSGPVTPETYLHSRGWDSFGNSVSSPDAAVHTYTAPTKMDLNKFYLGGTWQLVDDERQVLQSTSGTLGIRAEAGEVNLVLGLADGAAPVKADISVDGKMTKSITIDSHDLYNLYKGDYGQHDIVLTFHGKGVEAFAYTFGG